MKTFYLKYKKTGLIESKFELESDDRFSGTAYECVGWNAYTNEPIEYLYHSEVIAKFDGCSHWYFRGQDYNTESKEEDSYYHICCSFNTFIRIMCFVWKLAGNYHKDDLSKRNLLTNMSLEKYDLDLIDYMLKDYEIIDGGDKNYGNSN